VKTTWGPEDPNAGDAYSWNRSFHPNPYFLQEVNQNRDTRDRLIGNVTANYQLTEWLTAMGRIGTDWYEDVRREQFAAGNFGVGATSPYDYAGYSIGANGSFGDYRQGFQETNADFLLTASREAPSGIGLTASLGGNRRFVRRQENYTYVSDLSAAGVYSLSNAANTPTVQDYLTRRQVNSLYGQAEMSYNNFLFLTATGRNDWSSTLPDGNNSYFYPSLSGALVFTDAFPALNPGGILSYGKIRASWARVGNDAGAYQIRDTYASAGQPFGGVPLFTLPGSLKNSNLRPESTDAFEVGTDLRFLDERLSLDFSYYTKTTTDQIFAVEQSRASGFSSSVLNAGSVRNRGVELGLTVVPVVAGDFRWEATVNYGRNRNKVVSLTDGVDALTLGSFWGLRVQARAGEPYGELVGNGYVRDSQGRIVVSGTGRPLVDPTLKVLGNYNPDWTGSLSNTFSFRGLSLRALLDTKQGGDIFSVTHMFGTYAGVLAETAAGRCSYSAAYPSDVPACTAETGIVVPGVKVVAGDTVVNDIATNAQRYWKSLYGNHEAHIFDASFVKLREVTLGYDVPQTFSRRMGVSRMNVSLTGRNLALWTDVPHLDPESAFDASNVQGLEFGQLPTARSIGFNITVTP
jgi:outer membrane receptor protein involved in Fe transport